MRTLFGKELGEPSIDTQSCNTCELCVNICPSEVLSIENGAVTVKQDTSFFGCIACGHCMAVCPSKSITVSKRCMNEEDRVALPSKEEIATSEQFYALLLSRRSIRKFKKEEVSQEFIDKIIDISSTHPMGIPPTHVELTIFKGRDKVQEFAKEMVSTFPSSARFLKVLKTLLYPVLGKIGRDMFGKFVIPLLQSTHKKREEGKDVLLWDAPLAILVHSSPYAESTDRDIAATYIMLAAHALGLGCCMIGTVGPMLTRNKAMRKRYNIPQENKIGLMLVIGHPDTKFQYAIKRKFAKVSYAS